MKWTLRIVLFTYAHCWSIIALTVGHQDHSQQEEPQTHCSSSNPTHWSTHDHHKANKQRRCQILYDLIGSTSFCIFHHANHSLIIINYYFGYRKCCAVHWQEWGFVFILTWTSKSPSIHWSMASIHQIPAISFNFPQFAVKCHWHLSDL